MREPISEVYNMGCLDYMRTIPDKYFELCICDSPYGDALDVSEEPPHNLRGRFSRYQTDEITPPEEVNTSRRNVVREVRPFGRITPPRR